MDALKNIFIPLLFLASLLPRQLTFAQEPGPTPETRVLPTPAEVINAVNDLRLAYGLAPLAVHTVLMQVAQEQANGIASGLGGHWRPNGWTLGQWLMMSGYPLSGDLSQDGYRSENWIQANTAQEAVQAWRGDGPHSNTMLSVDRSDIGAGVAFDGEDVYIVLETALQTASGKFQFNAYPTMTALAGIPQNAGSSNGNDTGVSQYMQPVQMNTALPNGDVYHVVQYGQSLWSIAINYHTTILQIQQLNNLSDTTIMQGQKLLVVHGATQPATVPPPSATTPVYTPSAAQTATPLPFNVTATNSEAVSLTEQRGAAMSIWAIAIAALVLAGVFAAFFRKSE